MNLDVIKKLDVKTSMKISMMIDKMGIASDLINLEVNTGNESRDNQELAKRFISLIISNLYKVEKEIIDFISEYKNISREEAEKTNMIEFLKEIFSVDGAADFLV